MWRGYICNFKNICCDEVCTWKDLSGGRGNGLIFYEV